MEKSTYLWKNTWSNNEALLVYHSKNLENLFLHRLFQCRPITAEKWVPISKPNSMAIDEGSNNLTEKISSNNGELSLYHNFQMLTTFRTQV